MNTVCISCLNKISIEEKSYIFGTEIYHELCYINKVMGKAYKYAYQIKSLEPDQIISQLFCSNKFKLSEDELKIIKLQQSTYNENKSNNFNSTFDKMLNIINLGENSIVDAMYDSLSNSTNSNNELFKKFSKNEFKTLVDSSLNLIVNDNDLYEQIVEANSISNYFEPTFSDPEAITNKLMESLPEELKNKIINLKTEIAYNPNNFIKTDLDTESDTELEI
jgi:hypothetical protein